jgi:acyl-CoA thioesterase-1
MSVAGALRRVNKLAIAGLALGMAMLGTTPSNAAEVSIVALGASNTAGKGVSPDQAFPAQLEAMLRAKGFDVRVTNAGVSGDTTSGMLGRLNSSVPDGTQIAIVGLNNPANDIRAGEGARHAANAGAIVGQLRARHIKVIVQPRMDVPRQADGVHFTPEGHRMVAARLLPMVIAAIGKPRAADAH